MNHQDLYRNNVLFTKVESKPCLAHRLCSTELWPIVLLHDIPLFLKSNTKSVAISFHLSIHLLVYQPIYPSILHFHDRKFCDVQGEGREVCLSTESLGCECYKCYHGRDAFQKLQGLVSSRHRIGTGKEE